MTPSSYGVDAYYLLKLATQASLLFWVVCERNVYELKIATGVEFKRPREPITCEHADNPDLGFSLVRNRVPVRSSLLKKIRDHFLTV